MKRHFLILVFLLSPVLLWAQKELVIEGPNDKVASVTLQVKSEFDQDKGILKLSVTGDDTSEANALWLLQDPTVYDKLDKYFKQNDGKLSISSFAKEQMKFMNLTEKTAETVIQVVGAQMTDKASIQTKTGVKAQIQKQILPLDSRSTLVLNLKVPPETETVTLTLKNPLLLFNKSEKYELAFVGKEVSVDFNVTRDYCTAHTEMLIQLQEYNKVFGKGEAALQQAQAPCFDKVKSLLISEITQIDLKRFENTKCQELDDQLNALRDLLDRITNFEAPHDGGGASGGGGGSSAGSGGSGGGAGIGGGSTTPVVDDCNVKKMNDDLKAAVVKMNTYANDWISATDPAVKQAKKLAFDGLVKETDAKINALTPACRKKVDSGSLKNYEMAKKLINN